MACQVCKVPLAQGDNHYGCLLHRKCNRNNPCHFDNNEPSEYWDEVELLLNAAKLASSPRKSSRVANQSSNVKQKVKKMPPLSSFSSRKVPKDKSKDEKESSTISGKGNTKEKSQVKGKHKSTNKDQTGTCTEFSRSSNASGSRDSERSIGKTRVRDTYNKHSLSDPTPHEGAGVASGNTQSPVARGAVSDTGNPSINNNKRSDKNRISSGKSTTFPDPDPYNAEQVTEGIEHDTNLAEQDPENNGNPEGTEMVPQNTGNIPNNTGNVPSSAENVPNGSEKFPSDDGNGPENADYGPENAGNVPTGNGNIPSNAGMGPRNVEQDPDVTDRNPFYSDGRSENYGSAYFRERRFPEYNSERYERSSDDRDNNSSYDRDFRQQSTHHRQWPSRVYHDQGYSRPHQQYRYDESYPSNRSSGFYDDGPLFSNRSISPRRYYGREPIMSQPGNHHDYHSGTSTHQHRHEQRFDHHQSSEPFNPCCGLIDSHSRHDRYRLSGDSDFVSRPTSSSRVITSQPPPTLSVRSVTRPTMKLSVASRRTPSTSSSVPTDGHVRTDDPMVSSSDHDSPSDDIDMSAIMSSLRPRIDGNDDDDILKDDEDENDPESESLRSIFSKQKVNPVLRAAGMAAGVEFFKEEKPQASLIFGSLSAGQSKICPVLHMPPDIHNLQDTVKRRFKGTLKNSKFFSQILRVPDNDFEKLFSVPRLDSDAASFLKSQNRNIQVGYLPALERNLLRMDHEIKTLSRISAFQLLILNTLSIELSDSQSGDTSSPDGAFAMSTLASDLAGQQLSHSMRLSLNNICIRRDNVYAGLSEGKFKSDIVSRLGDLDLNNELLFNGKFNKSIRKVARKNQSVQSLGATLQASQPKSSYKDKGKGKGAYKGKSSSNSGKSRYSPYGKGRGSNRKSSQSSSKPSYGSQQKNKRRSDKGQSRDKGRGGPKSRF